MSVHVDLDGPVARIRLDRAPYNLFDTAQQRDAERAVAQVEACAGLRAVVFTGAHGHFSAGGDIREMGTLSRAQAHEYAERISALTRRVAALPVPVVAAVDGYALGGGCEVALAADIRICTPGARFALPETPLGLIPGAGGTQRLPRLIGLSRAKDIIFSGRHVDASEAIRIGLADAVVPATELADAVAQWCRRYTACPPAAVAAAKRAIDSGVEQPLENALDLERDLFAPLLAAGERTEHFQRFQASRAAAPAGAR